MWGVLDLGLLHGSSRFARHWLYFQETIDIFNETNPSGLVTDSIWNTRALTIAVTVSAVVAIKRLWLGLYLGKKLFANYAEDLAKVVKKMVVLYDVAALGRQFLVESMESDRDAYSKHARSVSRFGMSREEVRRMYRFRSAAV